MTLDEAVSQIEKSGLKRIEFEVPGYRVTAYRVITTIRIDLKPISNPKKP